MQGLLELAGQIGTRLKARGETVAVAESSAGGLIAASLLAQAGASAFFVSGAVVYTRQAREGLMGILPAEMEGIRSASEPYALLLARRLRERFGASWGLAETGASGPSGNSYGDAPGHSCLAISGPVELVRTIETSSGDRIGNMRVFAASALGLLHESL
jgi:PncC family amidohydrolase